VRHGTTYAYRKAACRCEPCRAAHAKAQREWKERKYGAPVPKRAYNTQADQDFLADLLHELFPDGLTDDCPARRGKAAA
jgi:hypothetical protein